MELYGTLRLGEKFRNFMELFNVSCGTEQLCFKIHLQNVVGNFMKFSQNMFHLLKTHKYLGNVLEVTDQ